MSKAAELAALIGGQKALGDKNFIINGAMQVAQRGTQTNQTSAYTACDRFEFTETGATVVTTSQDTTVPSGQGFTSSLKIDVTTADSSLASGDFVVLSQTIEAQNLQQLKYGTSSAENVTLSFWVRSPKTGTHIIELRHHDASLYNSQTYTISSADTWQYVTVTYSGYTATAINNDNGKGFLVDWILAAGSDFTSGTLSSDTWHSTQANRAVGQVNCVDNTANNFFLTGVQLEIGDVATAFEHEDFGTTLHKCRRYFEKITIPNGSVITIGQVFGSGASAAGEFHWEVEKRDVPSLTFPSVGRSTPNINWLVGNAGFVATSDGANTVAHIGVNQCTLKATSYNSLGSIGDSSWLYMNGGGTVSIDAEL